METGNGQQSANGKTVSRREILQLGGVLVGAAYFRAASAEGAGGEDPLSGERLYKDVVHYVSLGEHRTGTKVDLATSAWLLDEMRKAGLQAEYLPFPLRLFDMKACWVEVDGVKYQGYPEWFPTATGPAPVKGPLATLPEGASLGALKGKVWLTESDARRARIPAKMKKRIDEAGKAGALAAVVLVRHESGELAGRSAGKPWNDGPWCSIPLVGVAMKHKDALMTSAKSGAAASVLVDGDDRPNSTANDVIGRIGEGKDLIIVTTPSSGLSFCGGERGPGVALLLGLARWAGQRELKTRYLFSANSGHELMGLGVYPLVEQVVPPPDKVKCWLHLGSGIANWHWEETSEGLKKTVRQGGITNFVSSPEFVPILEEAFAHVQDLKPRTVLPGGELQAYMERGYKSFGFFGGNRYFHTVVDGPEQTAPELLEPIARGLAKALTAVEAV